MALSEANTISKQTPIDDALGRLHGRADTLENYLDSLVSRLESVLTPTPPRPETATRAISETANPSSPVPHARILHNIASNLDIQIERVRDLLERLAL